MSYENDGRQYYVDYFNRMSKMMHKTFLGGMAWDDIAYHHYEAVDKHKLFTERELAEMFPILFGGRKQQGGAR